MFNIFVWKIEKTIQYHLSKNVLFFVFCLFCLLLLSCNTLHIMLYTYICYWNTLRYKYFIQITFHVVKQSHALGKLTNISHLPSQIYANIPSRTKFSFVCKRTYTIIYMIIKKRLFVKSLGRPLFTKYAHCKPLFPFHNNA